MLSLGSENLGAVSCFLACLLGRGWEVWPLVAVSFCLEGSWFSDPAREVVPCEGSWNQIPQFTKVANSSSVEFAGRLPMHLVCCSMSVCVVLSLRLFTAFLVEKRQPNLSAACGLAGLPPRHEGVALFGNSRLKKRCLQYQQLHTPCLGAQLAAAAGW